MRNPAVPRVVRTITAMLHPPREQEQGNAAAARMPTPKRGDDPLLDVFEPGDDPKGWDRASIKLWSNAAERRRTQLSQEDLRIPQTDRLRALGDALAFGLCVTVGLVFFPLYIASIVAPSLSGWFWLLGVGAGIVAGAWAFVRMVSTRPEEYLDRYEAP